MVLKMVTPVLLLLVQSLLGEENLDAVLKPPMNNPALKPPETVTRATIRKNPRLQRCDVVRRLITLVNGLNVTVLDLVEGGVIELRDPPMIGLSVPAVVEKVKPYAFLAKEQIFYSVQRRTRARLSRYILNQFLEDFGLDLKRDTNRLTDDEIRNLMRAGVEVDALEAKRKENVATLAMLQETLKELYNVQRPSAATHSNVASNESTAHHPKVGVEVMVFDAATLRLRSLLQHPLVAGHVQSPVLVLVATESRGKSTVVDFIAVYPVTYTAHKMATKCPVRYVFREAETTAAYVNGEACRLDRVAEKVKEHMDSLDKISMKDLDVEIESPGTLDMEIVDMPGFPNKDTGHYLDVVKLLRTVLKKDHAIPIVVLDGSHVDPSSRFDKDLIADVLAPVRPRWDKETIFLVNMANKALPTLHKIEDLNLEGAPSYFLALVPNNENLDAMTVDERRDFLRHTREKGEVAFLKGQIGRVQREDKTSGAKVVEGIESRLGFQRAAKEGLTALLRQQLSAQLPHMESRLREAVGEMEREIRDIDTELNTANVTLVRELYDEFMTNWVASMRSIMGVELRHSSVSPTTRYSARRKWNFNPANTSARTYAEEYDRAHGAHDRFQHVLVPEELEKFLAEVEATTGEAPSGLLKTLGMRLVGHASIERVLKVFHIQVLQYDVVVPTDGALFSAGATMTDGVDGSLNVKKMMHNILKETMLSLDSSIEWLCNHLEHLFLQYAFDVERYLLDTEAFLALRGHNEFLHRLQSAFERNLQKVIGDFESDLRNIVEEHAEVLSVDEPMRLLMAQAFVNHDLSDICSDTPSESYNNATEAPTKEAETLLDMERWERALRDVVLLMVGAACAWLVGMKHRLPNGSTSMP